MLNQIEFTELLERVRKGDPAAAEECVRLYEPEIRRAARVRMTDPRLRRLVDSIDICQSVFGRFFVHAANGNFDIESPQHLLALLVTMTRNRVTDMARQHTAARRDVRRETSDQTGVVPDSEPTPASAAASEELLAAVRSRLSVDELDLVDRRSKGQSWQEIATDLGHKPDAVRKKLDRALERVRKEIGVE